MNKAGTWGTTVYYVIQEPTFLRFSLVENRPMWWHPEELRLKATKTKQALLLNECYRTAHGPTMIYMYICMFMYM